LSREIAFIIKWNPRSTPVQAIAAERVTDTTAPSGVICAKVSARPAHYADQSSAAKPL
jgi:Tfp pilus assembly protein FimV